MDSKSFKRWQQEVASAKLRDAKFITASGDPVEMLGTPEMIKDLDYDRDLGMPGQYPYTRGVHATMYRGRLWTMRQFAGFGSPEDTNQRFKYLLENGQTGLSVAFDLPTLMGRDADDPWSEGEVGVCGVSVSSLRDMEILFDGIPLDKVSTSMTINSPAIILLAFYIAVAEKQGVKPEQLRGTIQNDILKEYIAQKEYIFPPSPSMRIIVDMIEYCTESMPQWNTISISGYHIREAGSTALQELAFTLADGFAYIEAAMERGLDIDAFAPRLSFFFNAHNDFFEEIAKYRAARRIYARRMKEKYGAKKERSWMLRFHTQTAGCTLTAQQPENNIVRVAYQALAAVLGGTQSLHTNSMDETLALPSEKAVKIALRTQQILAYESGVPHTIDPLAGSYFMEDLTNKMEQGAEEYFKKIEELGGVIPAIEKGFFQREIAEAAYRYQLEIENNDRYIVGVNAFQDKDEKIEIPLLQISPEVEKEQVRRLQELKRERDNNKVQSLLKELKQAAIENKNLMPVIIEAAKAYATVGEMINTLKDVFGEYQESTDF
ncbi:methylmalonyl-CoA mutase, large subunit [Caldithrix abyssi DSM 13497]|uniref:Methylmalonyl-CoA mutase n=1 Tax=Caldithrix abyssi DSM 13497 TaxID=880073 RepID=H1XT53_CALAY|nr:methylmalonyl-CoA mutase family protein [Caldithrix abyssi]APF18632.1 methylmalonyl-CoA mutase [Caldithrix abyssi DSM 13497]EHO42620.1 methylmalonyl-CoA mutase, large subunit [Caldithrix abyssi DSM 13497]